jgi:chromosome segregation ATPase
MTAAFSHTFSLVGSQAELESAKSALRAAEQAVTAAVAEKEAAAQEFESLEAKVAAAQTAIQGQVISHEPFMSMGSMYGSDQP